MMRRKAKAKPQISQMLIQPATIFPLRQRRVLALQLLLDVAVYHGGSVTPYIQCSLIDAQLYFC